MDIWASIWPNPDADGKVHKSVVRDILANMDLSTKFEAIYVMVDLSGIEDDLDKLATARAIRTQRNILRASVGWNKKAICA